MTQQRYPTVGFSPYSTYQVGLSQTNAIQTVPNACRYTRVGDFVHAWGKVVAQAGHSGGGGRLIFNLPVPDAVPLDLGTSIGTFHLESNFGVFEGSVVPYAANTIAALRVTSNGAIVGDNPLAGDLAAGSVLSFNLFYEGAQPA